jgi:hypothetical protein
MQTVWPALPEFHIDRFGSVTSPIGRSGDVFICKLDAHLILIFLQPFPVSDQPALRGSPGAYFTAFWTAVKILVIFLLAQFINQARYCRPL